ncbi:MAG: peptidylprolyl isomerase [Candidatus Electrothrix sp. AR4]|nr:peptidylprolyl isomerase [Candidatus Electrothrix sp. AR4]
MCPVALTDTVTVNYTASLDNGEVVEKRYENDPFIVSIGSGALCKAVEACLFGMEPGEHRVVRVEPEDAYGPHIENLVQKIPLAGFQGKFVPKPGMTLSLTVEKEGEKHNVPATVITVKDEVVVVDYNHPLAGQVIVYDVTLININT